MSHQTQKRDVLNLIRAVNPVTDPDQMPDAPESLVEEIIGMTTPTNQPTRSSRRVLRVALVAAAFLFAVAGVAAAANWLVTPGDTTEIACNGEVIIPARSGDPVADCAAELDRQGIEYGELEAYANPAGGVAVREIGTEPDGYTPLGQQFTQDVALIQLEEALADRVDGLASRCMTSSEATALAEQHMNDLGLDLPMTIRAPELDGSGCAIAIVTNDREVIIAMDVIDDAEFRSQVPWDAFIAQMSAELDDSCLALDQAVPIADQIAIETDIGYMSQLDAIEDPTLECTELSVDAGGVVFIVLRGPVDQAVPPSRLPTNQ